MNEYAKSLVSRMPAGRVKGSHRGGSVIAGKLPTALEASRTASTLNFHTKRWAILFAKPLNKWKLHP